MGVMHVCNYPGCKKQFDRKYNLKCHLRIHSNEKPYRCHHQNCTRSFRWKSSLNHHLLSLDHTPVAARRERKARAAKRRQEQLAAAASASQLPGLDPAHPEKLPRPPVNPPPTPADRHWQSRPAADNFHAVPLEPARSLDLSDVSLSPAPSSHTAIPSRDYHRDLQFLSKPQPGPTQYEPRQVPHPGHGVVYHHQPRLQLQPPLVTSRTQQQQPHQPMRKPHFPAWNHSYGAPVRGIYDRRSLRVSRPHPLPTERHPTGVVAESARPRDIASIDSALEHPVDSINPTLVVKRENLEPSALSAKIASADNPVIYAHGEPPRDPAFVKHQAPPGQKLPLVSIFEDSSPVSLLSAVPPALDPLFPSYNFDSASLRSF